MVFWKVKTSGLIFVDYLFWLPSDLSQSQNWPNFTEHLPPSYSRTDPLALRGIEFSDCGAILLHAVSHPQQPADSLKFLQPGTKTSLNNQHRDAQFSYTTTYDVGSQRGWTHNPANTVWRLLLLLFFCDVTLSLKFLLSRIRKTWFCRLENCKAWPALWCPLWSCCKWGSCSHQRSTLSLAWYDVVSDSVHKACPLC